MMKKFLKNLALFLLLFFVADKLLYWKIQSLPNREFDKRLELIIEGKMNRDVLIFGSSRAQHNIYSDNIEDSLSQSVYNLGYRGASIDFQLFLLKSVLKHNIKPKIILLTVDDFREFLPEKTLQFRYDKLYSLVKYNEITKELIERKEISPFALGLYSARIGWEQFTKPKSRTKYDHWTKSGTSLLDFAASDFDKKIKSSLKYPRKKELQQHLKDFTEFQEICKNKNIRLVILIPPNYQNQNAEFVERIKSLSQDKNTIVYSKISPQFKNSDYFSDSSHLNRAGAILYTNEIIKLLKDNLKINTINP